jgi:hypothetical protein
MRQQQNRKNAPLRLCNFARGPFTKSDLASEARNFAAACERAEQKGDRAHALLHSQECLPDPALVREWARDFEQ